MVRPMNGSHPRAGRRTVVGLAVVLGVVAGCSGDGDVDGPAPSPTTSNGQVDAQAAVVAEIEALFTDYWKAVVTAQSGQSDEPEELFEGLATDETTEMNVQIARRYAQQGLTRTGEPVFSDVNVDVVRDTGVVSACMDESEWQAELSDGQTLPPQELQLKPHPVMFEVVNSEGGWLIGESIEPEGIITC